MKKGYTMAEILIALITIGVLSALVLPNLFYNVQSTMFKNARKAQRLRIAQGITMMSMRANRMSYGRTDSFINDLQRYMKISKICSDTNIADCWPYSTIELPHVEFNMAKAGSSEIFNTRGVDPDGNTANYTGDNAAFVTADGIPVLFNYNSSCSPNTSNYNKNCYVALVDVNGKGKPNQLGKDIVLLNTEYFYGVRLSQNCAQDRNNETTGGNGAHSMVRCIQYDDGDRVIRDNDGYEDGGGNEDVVASTRTREPVEVSGRAGIKVRH